MVGGFKRQPPSKPPTCCNSPQNSLKLVNRGRTRCLTTASCSSALKITKTRLKPFPRQSRDFHPLSQVKRGRACPQSTPTHSQTGVILSELSVPICDMGRCLLFSSNSWATDSSKQRVLAPNLPLPRPSPGTDRWR